MSEELTAAKETILRQSQFWGTSNVVAAEIWATLDASRAREKALVEALRNFIDDYRAVWLGEGGGATACDAALEPYRALISPYSTPSPDMPSDCHPQGE